VIWLLEIVPNAVYILKSLGVNTVVIQDVVALPLNMITPKTLKKDVVYKAMVLIIKEIVNLAGNILPMKELKLM
jgi:hypothetical protein